MAQLCAFKGSLPDDRTDLYSKTVNLLLERWQGRLEGDSGIVQLLNIPGLKMSDLESGLYRAAFKAHESGPGDTDQTARIQERDLVEWIRPNLGNSRDKAQKFVDYIRDRAGLLIAHGPDSYTFPHRSFQEFLAACHLLTHRDYPTEAAACIQKDPALWREVFILAAGTAARDKRLGTALDAVNKILMNECPEKGSPDGNNCRCADLAAQALIEIGLHGVRSDEQGSKLLDRTRLWLRRGMESGKKSLSAVERTTLGKSLLSLGDPRKEVLEVDAMCFCLAPAGDFYMGVEDEDSKETSLSFYTKLTKDYWVSRFPITVAQYSLFLKESGHDPADPDCVNDPLSCPVRWITWHEANQFCAWVTDRWRIKKWIQKGWVVRLPTEPEWEKAARGGIEIPVKPVIQAISKIKTKAHRSKPNPAPKRPFTWRAKKENPDLANFESAEIGATSPVGCFHEGRSPYGCEEMCGNVWEWTASLHGNEFPYPYQPDDGRENPKAGDDLWRILKGGNCYNDPFVRVGSRLRYLPLFHWSFKGFRVILPPFSLDSDPLKL